MLESLLLSPTVGDKGLLMEFPIGVSVSMMVIWEGLSLLMVKKKQKTN